MAGGDGNGCRRLSCPNYGYRDGGYGPNPETTDGRDSEVGPGPFVIFKYIIEYDIQHQREYNTKYVTMLLPKTWEVSYAQIGHERRGLNHPTYIK